MTEARKKELKEFKDNWARLKGYADWYDYRDWCKSNGFSEEEIGYDDLLISYGMMIKDKTIDRDNLDGNWISPIDRERVWQEDQLKKIFGHYPNASPRWQYLNGLILIALEHLKHQENEEDDDEDDDEHLR
jgi:hypothetical protein